MIEAARSPREVGCEWRLGIGAWLVGWLARRSRARRTRRERVISERAVALIGHAGHGDGAHPCRNLTGNLIWEESHVGNRQAVTNDSHSDTNLREHRL